MSKEENDIKYKHDAYNLYVVECKKPSYIEKILPVSRKKIYKWIREDMWKQKREDYHTGTLATVEKLRRMLNKDVQQMQELDPKSVDKIKKAVSSIRQMDKDIDKLAMVIDIMELFSRHIRSEGTKEEFKVIQKHLPAFLQKAREQYGKNRGINN